MTMKPALTLMLFAVLTCACATRVPKSDGEHSLLNVRSLVREHFDPLVAKTLVKDKRYQSILVGVVTPFGTEIFPFGTLTEQGAMPDENTIFEIGSVTKGLVGMLMAQASLNGTIDLDQPFRAESKLKLPHRDAQHITWRQLGQHTSGLPRLPGNLKPAKPLQPYLDYGLNNLREFLSGFRLARDPGEQYEYSNLGAGIAGYGLTQIRKKPLEALLRDALLDPLHLNDTRIDLNSEQLTRLAPVFLNGNRVEVWQWNKSSILQAAGALRSTMRDMTTLLKTMMGLTAQSHLPMITVATEPSWDDGKNTQLGLFWHRLKHENIIWHNGGTYGSSSFVGYDPDRQVGIVVLSNSQIIDKQGVDSRLDRAAIATIQKMADALKMDRPLKLLRDYDAEVRRRSEEFAKIPADVKDKSWVKRKLAHMFEIDQYMRNLPLQLERQNFSERETLFFEQGHHRRFYLMDWQNTRDLRALLKIHGWFKRSEWGPDPDSQAWLLVQHADQEPEFQKEVLRRLEKLHKVKETSGSNYAYLFDRIAASFFDPSKRRPQRYGTQGVCQARGHWEPLQIEDLDHVDQRRAEVGLGPLREYVAMASDQCK